MKTIACIFLLAASCLAQSGPNKPLSITGTQCVFVSVEGKATVAFQVTGSWSGTIQPQGAIDGQALSNFQVTPSTSRSPQSTVTGNGAFFTSVAGYSNFSLCGNTVTGTANVFVGVSRYAH